MIDFPPYRPPSEAHSALLRVTRGCGWNHCTFCGMYKNSRFEIRPLEEIKREISLLAKIFPYSRTVFIGDSGSLTHPDILEIVRQISRTFPGLKRITTYARALTLVKKKDAGLSELHEAGLNRVHVGLESGDPIILKKIRKGVTPEAVIRGGQKALAAGFELCFYVLCGIAGDGRWESHADGSARVINAVNPDFVRLRTLSLVANAPLYKTWQSGGFVPVSPLNRLQETRRLIEKIQVNRDCELASDHLTNYLWSDDGIVYRGVDGILPRDREVMLETIDRAIKDIKDRKDILDANQLVQQGVIQNL
jgi:biotin synthase-like enzyme